MRMCKQGLEMIASGTPSSKCSDVQNIRLMQLDAQGGKLTAVALFHCVVQALASSIPEGIENVCET